MTDKPCHYPTRKRFFTLYGLPRKGAMTKAQAEDLWNQKIGPKGGKSCIS